MKIKSLTLVGFKSFKNRTTLEFKDGVTAIVGPNGCGKSNVVDAIFWVLGDQSPKHLRTQHMSEIIFGGSEDYPAAGFAEVSMVFEREGLVIPKDFDNENDSTVSVTRRLYQDGDSEYLINQHRCRLKDLVGLFLDSGLVGQTYAIIEQGVIGRLLESKPEDRSLMIQEVAGLTKYKVKKDEATRKMKLTRTHLTRIEDLIQELEKQKISLEAQVEAAKQYKELSEKLETMTKVSKALEANITEQSIKEHGLALEKLDGDLTTILTSLNETQTQLELTQAELRALDTELKEKQGELEETQQTLESTKLEVNTLFHSRERLQLVLKQLDQDQTRIKAQISEAENRKQKDQEQLSNLETELSNFLSQNAVMVERYKKHSTLLEQLSSTLRDAMTEMESLQGDQSSMSLEFQRVISKIEAIYSQFRILFSAKTDLINHLKQIEENSSAIQRNLEDKQAALEAKKQESATLEGSIKDILVDVDNRKKTLQALGLDIQGDQLKVKKIRDWMQAQCAPDPDMQVPASIQPMVDVVNLPDNHQKAAWQFLSAYQHNWVSDDGSSIEALAQNIPNDRPKGMMLALGTPSEENSKQYNAESIQQLQGAEQAEKVWDPIWGNRVGPGLLSKPLYEVEAITNLIRIRQANPLPLPCHFRSKGGEILFDDGWLYFPPTQEDTSDMFHHRQEEQHLISSIEALEEKRQSLSALLAEKESAHLTQLNQLNELNNFIETLEKEVYEVQTELKHLEIEQIHIQRQLDQNCIEQDRLFNDVTTQRQFYTKLEENIAVIKEKIEHSQKQLREKEEEQSSLRDEIIRLKATYEHYESTRADRQQHVDRLKDEIQQLENRVADLQSELKLSELNQKQYEEELEKAGEDHEARSERVNLIEEKYQSLKSVVEALREKVEQKVDQKERQQGELRKFEQEQSIAREKRIHITTQLEALKEKLTSIEADTEAELPPEYQDEESKRKHLIKLQRGANQAGKALEALGDVNLLAIQQYEEASDRLIFLSGQRDDLLESLANLETTIEEIQKNVTETFMSAFFTVNDYFKQYFPILFKGGEGYLVLTEEEMVDGLPGVEIHAAPPGKRMKRNTLLSGGEKALVALALIVSLFECRPSPLLVLDEVDSPFDEVNVDAFIQLCKKLSKRSQVFLITHNKKTMHAADCLYGVTLKEKGVSQIVSVKLVKEHFHHPTPALDM